MDKEVSNTLSLLVKSYFPSETASERQQDFYESYCKTLLGSSMRPNSNLMQNPLLHSNNQNITRNAENILNSGELKHSRSVLYVLQELSKQNNPNSYLPSSLCLPSLTTPKKYENTNIEKNEEEEIEIEKEIENEIMEEKENITEAFIVQCCINSIQGIESKLVSWQNVDVLEQDPFAEKPIFVVEKADSDDEMDMDQEQEINERVKQQQIENDILDRYCTLKKTQKDTFRVTPHFRYGISALPSSQLELVEKICYTGTLYINICKQISTLTPNAGIILQSVLSLINQWIKVDFYHAISLLDPLSISLRSLYVWNIPFTRLFERMNLALSEISRTKSKGGHILSILYHLSNHGNPEGKNVARFYCLHFVTNI